MPWIDASTNLFGPSGIHKTDLGCPGAALRPKKCNFFEVLVFISCEYVCIYTCYEHVYSYVYICIYINIPGMYKYMYVCVYVCVYMYVYMCACTYSNIDNYLRYALVRHASAEIKLEPLNSWSLRATQIEKSYVDV